MSHQIFLKMQLLHFDDASSKSTKSNNMLAPIQDVFDLELVSTNGYIAGLCRTVDEQLVPFRRCFQ